MTKPEVLRVVKKQFVHSFRLSDVDELKPWGAYYRICDDDAKAFVEKYYDSYDMDELRKKGSISPKILVFEPGKKLSLQYHERRAELWRVLQGKLIAALSDDDTEGEWREYPTGAELSYGPLIRHRAGALDYGEWVVVAEIWRHTDPNHPTDEDDIVRLVDDFGRV